MPIEWKKKKEINMNKFLDWLAKILTHKLDDHDNCSKDDSRLSRGSYVPPKNMIPPPAPRNLYRFEEDCIRPEILANALQDKVHKDIGISRPGKVISLKQAIESATNVLKEAEEAKMKERLEEAERLSYDLDCSCQTKTIDVPVGVPIEINPIIELVDSKGMSFTDHGFNLSAPNFLGGQPNPYPRDHQVWIHHPYMPCGHKSDPYREILCEEIGKTLVRCKSCGATCGEACKPNYHYFDDGKNRFWCGSSRPITENESIAYNRILRKYFRRDREFIDGDGI